MKYIKPFLFIAVIVATGLAASIVAEAAETNLQKIQEIRNRVLNNEDSQALAEAAQLPSEVAIPFLDKYLLANKDNKSERFNVARETLISIPNYDKYYSKKLALAAANQGVDQEAFDSLSLLATRQAQAVIAPYLFDFSITPGNAHIRSEVNALSASLGLGRMNLKDSPTTKKPEYYSSEDVLAWQKWVIDRGFVPKSSQVGVPKWLIELETLASTPQPKLSVPEQTASTPMTREASQAPSATPEIKTVSHGFPIWLVVGFVGAIVAIFGFLLRRKSS